MGFLKSLWVSIVCALVGHSYYEYARPKEDWGKGIRWLKCFRCGEDFAINSRNQTLVPMDYEIKDLHQWELAKREVDIRGIVKVTGWCSICGGEKVLLSPSDSDKVCTYCLDCRQVFVGIKEDKDGQEQGSV